MPSPKTTIGIDVGGIKKGFHAVANRDGHYLAQYQSQQADDIAAWALAYQPSVIAIDAPCMFSQSGRSRKAEQDLVKHGIRCFYTPTRMLAKQSHFYDWVFNGELLYQALGWPIFMGNQTETPCLIETFPHGIQLSLCENGTKKISGDSKSVIRKNTLALKAHYDLSQLSCIDFIDAALCAVSADYFANHQFTAYGCNEDGFIVLPKKAAK